MALPRDSTAAARRVGSSGSDGRTNAAPERRRRSFLRCVVGTARGQPPLLQMVPSKRTAESGKPPTRAFRRRGATSPTGTDSRPCAVCDCESRGTEQLRAASGLLTPVGNRSRHGRTATVSGLASGIARIAQGRRVAGAVAAGAPAQVRRTQERWADHQATAHPLTQQERSRAQGVRGRWECRSKAENHDGGTEAPHLGRARRDARWTRAIERDVGLVTIRASSAWVAASSPVRASRDRVLNR